jgi:RNA polymerase sigma factor (TIGR02999 family)
MTDSLDSTDASDTSDASACRLAATAQELAPLLLDDLRRRARRERRRVSAGETLRTTALVNEAFLRLHRGGGWEDERHFLHAAALAMRQALVDHARRRLTEKRGGGRVDSLDDHPGVEPFWTSDEQLVELDEALRELAALNPRLAQMVECRFFGGYSERETARILDITDRTVRRDWIKARAWLYQRLEAQLD